MTFDEAIKLYRNDKPDIRFGMKFIGSRWLVKRKKISKFS